MNYKEDLEYIKDHDNFLEHNRTKLDIYDGNLKPYVLAILKKTLNAVYYNSIESRVVPINILNRVMDKLSKVYSTAPMRIDANYQMQLDYLSREMKVNQMMSVADTYSHLFRCYALEPYLYKSKPQMRVLPADRFLVRSESTINPLDMTCFYKFMGKKTVGTQKKNVIYKYTADEFRAFTDDGEDYMPAYEGNDGVNPIGRIPFVYGLRSQLDIIPKCDTDLLQMSTLIPVLLSDLGGAVMYQCFSLIYGIDLDMENITHSPNAVLNLKSNPKSDKTPQIGTIKPEADIEQVLEYIRNVFSFWLECKGVRIGSVGQLDSGNQASGISKIIDEMDVYEIKKTSIQYFINEEKELWSLMKDMNNHWVKTDSEFNNGIIGDDFDPAIIFDEPKPNVSRSELIDNLVKEIDNKLNDRKTAIQTLYPDLSGDEIDEKMEAIDEDDDGKEEPVNGGVQADIQSEDSEESGE
jgi:hypothetical protein